MIKQRQWHGFKKVRNEYCQNLINFTDISVGTFSLCSSPFLYMLFSVSLVLISFSPALPCSCSYESLNHLDTEAYSLVVVCVWVCHFTSQLLATVNSCVCMCATGKNDILQVLFYLEKLFLRM